MWGLTWVPPSNLVFNKTNDTSTNNIVTKIIYVQIVKYVKYD